MPAKVFTPDRAVQGAQQDSDELLRRVRSLEARVGAIEAIAPSAVIVVRTNSTAAPEVVYGPAVEKLSLDGDFLLVDLKPGSVPGYTETSLPSMPVALAAVGSVLLQYPTSLGTSDFYQVRVAQLSPGENRRLRLRVAVLQTSPPTTLSWASSTGLVVQLVLLGGIR